MITLQQWAIKHGVSILALAELRTILGHGMVEPEVVVAGQKYSEAYQASLIRLEAARQGVWLTRNNVGALQDRNGRVVRYGLANESKAQNEAVKSGDFIGIYSFTIQPQHVGQLVGQFVSVETKEKNWQYSGTPHELAQRNWLEFVVSKGGAAMFASEPSHLSKVFKK